METAAYYVALLFVAGTPYLFIYWLLLHPLAPFWRRLGPTKTALVVHPVLLLLAAAIFLCRDFLLSIHFGVSAPLVGLAVLSLAVSLYIDKLRGQRMSFHTLQGAPEFSREQPGELITTGIYSLIRHPRYVSGFFGTGAFALFTSYLAVYVVWAAYIPIFSVLVLLEERELRARFGTAYEVYSRRVPRFVPRFAQEKSSQPLC